VNRLIAGIILLCALLASVPRPAWAAQRFPPPDFESGHTLPSMTRPLPRAGWRETGDVVVLVTALSLAAWFALGMRSRKAVLWLSVFALAYFGFYRGGCICPIGAIQNVSLAIADPTYTLPFTVVVFFTLPLLFALLFGRVFCGGVCPLGAMQDLVLVRPLQLPTWLGEGLGVLPFLYLGAAVLLAATDTMFVICRYDPFVPFFRLSGPFHMLVAGGLVVLISMFIGRPYCRFLCPYGALLGIVSRFAWRRASITPDTCLGCSLCEKGCPFGAIIRPTPQGVSERQ